MPLYVWMKGLNGWLLKRNQAFINMRAVTNDIFNKIGSNVVAYNYMKAQLGYTIMSKYMLKLSFLSSNDWLYLAENQPGRGWILYVHLNMIVVRPTKFHKNPAQHCGNTEIAQTNRVWGTDRHSITIIIFWWKHKIKTQTFISTKTHMHAIHIFIRYTTLKCICQSEASYSSSCIQIDGNKSNKL